MAKKRNGTEEKILQRLNIEGAWARKNTAATRKGYRRAWFGLDANEREIATKRGWMRPSFLGG